MYVAQTIDAGYHDGADLWATLQASVQPLSTRAFCTFVLTQEVLLLLIQEDLGVDQETALRHSQSWLGIQYGIDNFDNDEAFTEDFTRRSSKLIAMAENLRLTTNATGTNAIAQNAKSVSYLLISEKIF